MRRLAFLALLAAAILVPLFTANPPTHGRPVFVAPSGLPIPAPQLPTWTPPFWNPNPSAPIVHRSICFTPDMAPINRTECWPIDANSYPYGPYYIPAVG